MTQTPTPTAVAPAPAVRGATPRRLWIAGAVILAALGFLVVKGLGNATVFFKTVDEAVRQQATLGTRRFRIEGVVENWKQDTPGQFDLTNNGQNVRVAFSGTQPSLFRNGIPVVLEGRFDGPRHYASDLIMVKHTESYRVQHPDRVQDYSTTTTTP
jgi:cytochrome c-type biogenesis protein CcmE